MVESVDIEARHCLCMRHAWIESWWTDLQDRLGFFDFLFNTLERFVCYLGISCAIHGPFFCAHEILDQPLMAIENHEKMKKDDQKTKKKGKIEDHEKEKKSFIT